MKTAREKTLVKQKNQMILIIKKLRDETKDLLKRIKLLLLTVKQQRAEIEALKQKLEKKELN